MVTHVSGDNLGASNTQLTTTVNPGETVEIALPMVAPEMPRSYESWWQIKDPDGQSIGKAFYARINVVGPDTGVTQPTIPAEQTIPAPPPQRAADTCAYVASKNSGVFHHPGCYSADRIKASNLICFSTRAEAVASGRRPCKNCNP